MKFRTKPSTVDAIIFNYNPAGVAALMEFAGNDFTGFHKAREAGSKAVATIAGRAFQEGCYVVREDHDFRPMNKDVFEAMYEAMPVFPVPPVWPTVPGRVPAEKKEPAKVFQQNRRIRKPSYYLAVESAWNSGKSLGAAEVSRKLNAAGLTTPTGLVWTPERLNAHVKCNHL